MMDKMEILQNKLEQKYQLCRDVIMENLDNPDKINEYKIKIRLLSEIDSMIKDINRACRIEEMNENIRHR